MRVFRLLPFFVIVCMALDCPVGYTVIETCHKLPQPTSSQTINTSQYPDSNTATNWLSLMSSLRNDHNAPPLTINKELVLDAQNTAKKCTLDSSSSSSFGQTSYKEYIQTPSTYEQAFGPFLTKAISSWYKPIDKYDFSNPQFTPECGHATQLLWKSTTQIGCGIQLCKEHTTLNFLSKSEFFYFVLCDYYPPGNVKGLFEQNVFPKA